MTDQVEMTDEQIQTAFADVGMKVPAPEQIADARQFVDKHMTHRWVEDMLVPVGVPMGELIEPEEPAEVTHQNDMWAYGPQQVYPQRPQRTEDATDHLFFEGIVPAPHENEE